MSYPRPVPDLFHHCFVFCGGKGAVHCFVPSPLVASKAVCLTLPLTWDSRDYASSGWDLWGPMFAHFRLPFTLCSQVHEPLKEDETRCLVLLNSSVTCSSSRFVCDYVSTDVGCHNQYQREHIGNWHISLLSLPLFLLKQTPGSGELEFMIVQVVHPISLVYCYSATPCLHVASSRIQANWPLLAQYNIV